MITASVKTAKDNNCDFPNLSFIVSSDDCLVFVGGARCSSVVRTFAHAVMGRRIDPSWDGPIELFLVPASAPQLV